MSSPYHWYIARPDELFIDLDNSTEEVKRLKLCIARLRGAKQSGALDWDQYFPYQSENKLHYHMMVRLKAPMSPHDRLLWESRFCDDHYRFCMNFARLQAGGNSWSLLISPVERRSYPRKADYTCHCPTKHKREVMRDCPVAKLLNCTLAEDHFGNPIWQEDKPKIGSGNDW